MNLILCRFTPLFWIAVAYLALSSIGRIVLWAAFGTVADVPISQLPPILAVGLINDAVEGLYLLAPLALYLSLLPERWIGGRVTRALLAVGTWLSLFGLIYLGFVEYFFFEEFDARFNLVAVDYLMYPHEVFVNIWESYPVAQVLALTAVLASLLLRLLWPPLRASLVPGCRIGRRIGFFAAYVAALAAAIAGFSTQTLAYSQNRVENELAANGLSSLFQAFHTNELDFNRLYRTGDPEAMRKLMIHDLDGPSAQAVNDQSLDRHFVAKGPDFGRLNVVLVVEESFGCEHVSACGSDKALTPHFDALSRQGLFFSQAYATGTRTARGLEAITASLAPIPSESIMKRPGYERIGTWGEIMQGLGYHTSFLYGGFGEFDNMNNYFGAHGFAVSDRKAIERVRFANIWGVADQDLFDHALDYFDQRDKAGKPFFSLIMSTSNHKPYTFPDGLEKEGVPKEGGGRNAGVRYADLAMGEFMEKAKDHPWYGNTVFVLVADHGARVYGKQRIPMYSYHIPLLIMAPGRLQPRVIDTPASQVDVAPTVMGLLGLDFTAPFIGRNLLTSDERPVTLLFNHNHDVALFRDGRMAVLGLQKSADVYEYHLGQREVGKTLEDPALTELATAYYQTTFDLFQRGKLR